MHVIHELQTCLNLIYVEPLSVKEQIIKSATEVASMLLRIDDVIASSKSAGGGGMPPGGMGGMPPGMDGMM